MFRRSFLKLSLGAAIALALVFSLSGCSESDTSSGANPISENPASSDVLASEVYEPQFDLGIPEVFGGELEIRRVTDTSAKLGSGTESFVDFESQNMALSIPLTMLSQAAEDDALVGMRHYYKDGGDQKSIIFYLPEVQEYDLYFPEAKESDLSLLICDALVSDKDPSYAFNAYLIYEQNGEETAIKMSSLTEKVIMRETGVIDEKSLDARLYRSVNDDVYKPTKIAYTNEKDPGSSFVDTYLYGSFTSTEGALIDAGYTDVTGHYAEPAIKQVQKSYNLAEAITAGNSFEPDRIATDEEVNDAMGAFCSQPVMSDEVFEIAKPQIVAEYPLFTPLIKGDEPNLDTILKDYVARTPYGQIDIYASLAGEAELTTLTERGHAINTRIDVALMLLGMFTDDTSNTGKNGSLAVLPDEETTEQWLLGVTDIEAADPLRPYAAWATHYGLLSPDSEGKLHMFDAITRADLCVAFANMSSVYDEEIASNTEYKGYTQKLLYEKDPTLVFDVTGEWDLTAATRADGSAYSADEITAQQASFTFKLGDSREHWENEEYLAYYRFSLKDRTMTLLYSSGEFETLELNADLTELTYHYVYDDDPEFSGETYFFTRK